MRKGFKICCGLSLLLVIIVLVVLIIVFFTVLKPKQPEVFAHPAHLTHIKVGFFPAFELNATLALLITINNRIYGSFKYNNGTAYVYYRGIEIAEAAIDADNIPARSKHNISTNVDVTADKMVFVPSFWDDVGAGLFNFSSSTTLHGKASLLKIFKIKAVAETNCNISILFLQQRIDSNCYSKIKL
ncbi:uncharacterized protein LOC113352324 [Papaver somniferum]|uniref:uncharacterized protein LOC113352324 n=1 Tax=Papaver somniferum TaxID=3469 RepID=UPI000E6F8445|nr:uncharacterized protein LOC113352324 [Papaver somniferum]